VTRVVAEALHQRELAVVERRPIMLVRDVMTRQPVCCKPNDTLDAVARLMRDHNCGEIPVCDGTKIVGVITDRDIAVRAVATGKTPALLEAIEVMSKPVVTISEEATLGEALEMMEEKLVRRLPVLDNGRKIAGIISQADLMARVPTLKVARVLKTVARRTRKSAYAAA
jgi:CBS domain-containing protein